MAASVPVIVIPPTVTVLPSAAFLSAKVEVVFDAVTTSFNKTPAVAKVLVAAVVAS